MAGAVLEQTCRVQRRVRDLPARVVGYLLLAGCLFAELGTTVIACMSASSHRAVASASPLRG